jgi:dephospho-CoA kinase
MKVIGLTGGIGSGKSTVAQFLAELGAVIIDLDKVGHEALQQEEVRGQLVRKFGKDILNVSGEVDRAKLGRLVFNNRKMLLRLNRIVHPVIDNMVTARIEEYRREEVRVIVLEAAAMLEARRASQADELWVTTAPNEIVHKRLAGRSGYSAKETKVRIDSQMTDEERIRHADVVIETDCTFDELKVRVAKEWQRLQARL